MIETIIHFNHVDPLFISILITGELKGIEDLKTTIHLFILSQLLFQLIHQYPLLLFQEK